MNRRSILLASALASPAIIHTEAYANTLTGLIPALYTGLDIVSRELVGFIPVVNRAPGVDRAAVGQDVTYFVPPTMQSYDIQPAMNVPQPPDVVLGSGTMKITKAKAVPFGVTGEEQRALNTGIGWQTVQAGLFAQGLRTLVNEVEADIAAEAINASRAYGTPGSTPFANANGLADSAQVRKILDDNGAPLAGRALIINTAAGANQRSNNNLVKANEAGTTMTLRDGELGNLHGMSVHESAAVLNFVKGTAAGATTNGTGYAVGARDIVLAAAGTGTIKQGDTIQFAGDTNKYVVESGLASVAAGGAIRLRGPGLRVAIPAAATALTLGASAAYNLAISDGALHVVMRKPALPNENDLAIDAMDITDPRSGVTFEIRVYPGYRMVRYEVGLAWGTRAVKPEHMALLLG